MIILPFSRAPLKDQARKKIRLVLIWKMLRDGGVIHPICDPICATWAAVLPVVMIFLGDIFLLSLCGHFVFRHDTVAQHMRASKRYLCSTCNCLLSGPASSFSCIVGQVVSDFSSQAGVQQDRGQGLKEQKKKAYFQSASLGLQITQMSNKKASAMTHDKKHFLCYVPAS